MPTLPLNVSTQTTLSGGAGTSNPIGPTAQGEVWNVQIISLQCSTNVNEAIGSVYLGGNLIGTTTWGSTGDSDTGITLIVNTGQTLTATWTGGDSGALATMAIMGTKTVLYAFPA
jgi:hypothetical protein